MSEAAGREGGHHGVEAGAGLRHAVLITMTWPTTPAIIGLLGRGSEMAAGDAAARREIKRLAREHLDSDMRARLARQLDEVPSHLAPGENVMLLTDAYRDGCGLLVVTVDRLIYLPERGDAWSVLFDAADVGAEAVPTEDDRRVGDLVVTVDGERRVFEAVGMSNGRRSSLQP